MAKERGSPLPPVAHERVPVRANEAPEVPRGLELLATTLIWGAAGFGLLGVIGAVVPQVRIAGLACAIASLALGLGGLLATLKVPLLRHLRAEITGGLAYDELRGLRTLRVFSALLQFLGFAASMTVLLRVLARLHIVGIDLESEFADRAFLVLTAAIAAALAGAHLQSLRTPTPRDISAPTIAILVVALSLAAGCGLFGMLSLAGTRPAIGALTLERDDTGLLVAFGYACLGFALSRARGLPTAASLLADEPSTVQGTAQVSRTKAVLVPTILAFALLLAVFLLVLLFGIGLSDVVSTVGSNPLLLGSLLFIVVALVGSLLIAVLLSRSAERDAPLYAKLPDRKVKQIRLLLSASSIVAGVFAALALASVVGVLPETLTLHFVCLAVLVAVGPYGFYIHRDAQRIRRLEERFPDFLRDIASSHKGGLTLAQSVTIAARGEYGPLTPEVRKMADQLSWNVSFHEALTRFAERVETPLVQRATNLIIEADRSGGATTDVLLAAARDAREIKNLENERRQTMGLYTIVVYITFFVFLGVAATLYAKFAPEIVHSVEASQGGLTAGNSQAFSEALDLSDYQRFYFVAALVQAVGDGLVAGLLGTGQARLGLRHAFIMVLATYVIFALMLV